MIAINASRGVVTQVTLHPDAWDPMPDGLTLDGRAVRLDWDQNLDPHAIILTFGENERLHLLVVPPQARMRRAAAAMAAAEESGNGLQASELLRQLSILPSSGESVEGHSQGGAP